MINIYMTRNTMVRGRVVVAGTTIEVDEILAKQLVNMKKAIRTDGKVLKKGPLTTKGFSGKSSPDDWKDPEPEPADEPTHKPRRGRPRKSS